jgi:hypothetical protein
MSFSQNLVLWLHVAFVVFTIGPVTLATMSTPRYIRQHNTVVLRYLNRITLIFTAGSLGVLIAGMALASMKSWDGQPWVIISATLFIVALLLLGLIVRDQRKAIRSLDEAVSAAPATTAAPSTAETDVTVAEPADTQPPEPRSQSTDAGHQGSVAAIASHVANVERGRIAMTGGVVSLIWLVILVLMVWH